MSNFYFLETLVFWSPGGMAFLDVVIATVSFLLLRQMSYLYDKRLRILTVIYKIYSLFLFILLAFWSIFIFFTASIDTITLGGGGPSEGGLDAIFYVLILFGVLIWLISTVVYFGLGLYFKRTDFLTPLIVGPDSPTKRSGSIFKKIFITGPSKEKSFRNFIYACALSFVGILVLLLLGGGTSDLGELGFLFAVAVVFIFTCWLARRLWFVVYNVFSIFLILIVSYIFYYYRNAVFPESLSAFIYSLIILANWAVVSLAIILGHIYYYWKNRDKY